MNRLKNSFVAQRKRAGLITRRSLDRNKSKLAHVYYFAGATWVGLTVFLHVRAHLGSVLGDNGGYDGDGGENGKERSRDDELCE